MATKKFENLNNPAEMFIDVPESKTEPAAEAEKTQAEVLPSGDSVAETKSRRMQVLVRPTTYEALKACAVETGKSVNDMLNTILEEALNIRR